MGNSDILAFGLDLHNDKNENTDILGETKKNLDFFIVVVPSYGLCAHAPIFSNLNNF